MEFKDALPFLEQEHSAVVTTIGRSGLPQATIVRAGPYEGTMAFVVRGGTVKLANLKRDDRCTVLVAKPDWTRYATVEGRAATHRQDNTGEEELRMLLREGLLGGGRDALRLGGIRPRDARGGARRRPGDARAGVRQGLG